ncbi:MAG: asparaginase [Candidatus Sericytochromatia bacterium]|nr:asparaginase [Candidatus Tanganyikabacteria bacterium]
MSLATESRQPEGLGSAPEPLVAVWRGPHVESVHFGWFALVDARGDVEEMTPDAPRIFARSTAKPFQALPLLRSGAAAVFGLEERHLALTCASHAGEAVHQEGVRALLERAGLEESMLGCGMHAPFSAPRSAPGLLANNCSGKHSGMLATCRHQRWSTVDYLDPAHPLQQQIAAILEEMGGYLPDSEPDGCSAPSWHLPIEALARAFSALPKDPDGARLLAAMAAHPLLVAGTGRRDSVLMEVTGGRLVSKGGAEGVTVGVCRVTGRAWALKVADGTSRAVGPALLAFLRRFGLIDANEAQRLEALAVPELRNHAGTRVGRLSGAGRIAP